MTTDCSFNWQDIRGITGPCIRPGGPVLTRRALEICNLPPGSRVVDVGCGAGGTLECLERTGIYYPVGLDRSEALLREAGSGPASGGLVRGRAEALPFKACLLDAIFCECVLSILGDKIAPLQEFARVLREGGFLIISDVFTRSAPGQGRPEPESQRIVGIEGLLAKEDLIGYLTGLGFSLVLWEEHERLLKEFAARMILAGEGLPDLWGCRQGIGGKKVEGAAISYLLLVARKSGATSGSSEHKKSEG
jgi:arsenite methyltransferase